MEHEKTLLLFFFYGEIKECDQFFILWKTYDCWDILIVYKLKMWEDSISM
jgi:hypothetical protein